MKYPPVHYHDYLKLDALLTAQSLKSQELTGQAAHDELLFITVHQTYELWFKQIIFELESIFVLMNQNFIPEKSLSMIVPRLERVNKILHYLVGQIDLLETMTPLDFLDFRDFLFPASGFQSLQFRKLECLLGLTEKQRTGFNSSPFWRFLKPDQEAEIKNLLSQKSLFDLVEAWLARTPYLKAQGKSAFAFSEAFKTAVENSFTEDEITIQKNQYLSAEEKERNLKVLSDSRKTFGAFFDPKEYASLVQSGQFRFSYDAIQAALLIVSFQTEPALFMPFKLLSGLMDLDEVLTLWRTRHGQMALRMLGKKIGTGGSSGHDYLQKAAQEHRVFMDLFQLTTFLLPKQRLPKLPEDFFR